MKFRTKVLSLPLFLLFAVGNTSRDIPAQDLGHIPQGRGMVTQAVEPYSSVQIMRISKLLPLLSNDDNKARLAAVLYRYGVPEGEKYLSILVKRGNVVAATVFALKQDTQYLDEILTIQQENPLAGELELALGTWKSKKIMALFEEIYKKQPGNVALALALAKQGDKASTTLMREVALKVDADDWTMAGLQVASLHLDGNEAAIVAMIQGVVKDPSNKYYEGMLVIEAIEYLGANYASDALESIIDAYISYKPNGDQEAVDALESLATRSAEALASLKHGASRDKIIQAMIKAKSRTTLTGVDLILSGTGRLGSAAVRLDPSSPPRDLETIMGSDWIQEEQRKAKLNFLPKSFLVYSGPLAERMLPVFK